MSLDPTAEAAIAEVVRLRVVLIAADLGVTLTPQPNNADDRLLRDQAALDLIAATFRVETTKGD